MTESVNISEHLRQRATTAPFQVALYAPAGPGPRGRMRYMHLTYAQLESEVALLAQGLHAAGLVPGTRVAVMVPPSLAFFVLTFALFRSGLVPVFIDPGMGLKSLKRCLAEAAPEVFIGVPKAHLARLLFGWGRSSLKRLFHVGSTPLLLCGQPLASLLRPPGAAVEVLANSASIAAILFTSGSTGAPKGVIYGHAQFQAQIAALRELFQFTPGEMDLGTFPLFALFAPALGMTGVIPIMDFTRPAAVDAAKIFAAIDDFGVTNMFGSPALLRALARSGVPRGVQLPSLKRVISAGASVDAKILRAATTLLAPGVEIHTPYGATEVLPVACIGSREVLGETAAATARGQGLCVGRPAPGVSLNIIKISDAPIAAWDDQLLVERGQVGEIVVSAPQVTQAYDGQPQANLLAKIRPSSGSRLLHRMGDLGYLDALGRLWFCGRKAHRLRLASGLELYTEMGEGIFNAQAGVYRSALVGRGALGAMQPVLCVEAEQQLAGAAAKDLRAALLQTAASHPLTAEVATFRFYKQLPVDTRHNSKIFREQLKRDVDRIYTGRE